MWVGWQTCLAPAEGPIKKAESSQVRGQGGGLFFERETTRLENAAEKTLPTLAQRGSQKATSPLGTPRRHFIGPSSRGSQRSHIPPPNLPSNRSLALSVTRSAWHSLTLSAFTRTLTRSLAHSTVFVRSSARECVAAHARPTVSLLFVASRRLSFVWCSPAHSLPHPLCERGREGGASE